MVSVVAAVGLLSVSHRAVAPILTQVWGDKLFRGGAVTPATLCVFDNGVVMIKIIKTRERERLVGLGLVVKRPPDDHHRRGIA